jgi:hypothetical protein
MDLLLRADVPASLWPTGSTPRGTTKCISLGTDVMLGQRWSIECPEIEMLVESPQRVSINSC